MSAAAPIARSAGRLSLGRQARLAAKELKETLRDRRTIITLVLMPLLVYPVLSLAFRQFLVSSLAQKTNFVLLAGTSTQEEWRKLKMLLQRGDKLLREHESPSAVAPTAGGPVLGADLGASEPSLEDFKVDTVQDLEAKVLAEQLDLGVRFLDPAMAREDEAQVIFQLILRPNSPLSRRAASFVERRLRAVNDADLRERLARSGDERPPVAAWRMRPVGEEAGNSFWLGTLVPLILILMTITGAVYPAIDLTAGERERGTLEALMAAPIPRLGLLLAKYVAVVTVAMLTAVVNLTAMTVTIASSELGPTFFGDQGLSPVAIATVLALLVLFAAFFSAVLLAITSFARSFKEAQAYLIPLMLVSLAPGLMSIMPGLELGPLLSVTPLANIVLLARDVLKGGASPLWGSVAVLSTVLYGSLALALAARIFGSDAILYGSQGSWSDLFRRPDQPRAAATIPGALTTLAIVMPLFVIAGGVLARLHMIPMPAQLGALAGTALLLFGALPLALARMQGVSVETGFQLRRPAVLAAIGAVLLGGCLWTFAYDLIVLCQDLGIATLSLKKLEEAQPGLETLFERWRAIPLPLVLLAFALTPAVAEEFYFRGYLLGAFRERLPAWAAIGLTAVIFGLFHASVGGIIAIERVLASTLLGVVLGSTCWSTRSIWPGVVLHALNNSLMLLVARYGREIKASGWDLEEHRYLPPALLAVAALVAAAGLWLVWLGREKEPAAKIPPASQPAALPVAADSSAS